MSDGVHVKITVEAQPCEEDLYFSHEEWDSMTPEERDKLLLDATVDALNNAGGAGYHIVSGATDKDLEY